MKRPRFAWLLALLPALGCAGRGDISGTVTCNGKTVCSGTVTFVASDSLPYQVPIGDDGSYTLLQVPVGAARIGVTSPGPAAPARKLPKEERDRPAAPQDVVQPIPLPKIDATKWIAIPKEFQSFETSEITFQVRGGKNQFDINIP